ncbi:MAG: hypothetical protein JWM80_1646 [Cyanobacteria bacterium RYN_339]|nr:hypothetical protein [Cyanobacteria bacterium RYN_339]
MLPLLASLAITYQAPYCASLYWEVQALAGGAHVNVAAYRQDWGMQPGDQAMLAAFQRIKADYHGSFPRRPARENAYLPMAPLGDTAVDTRFDNCFLASASLPEAWARVDGLLAEDDARDLRRVLAHFEPRFAKRFKRLGYLAKYRDEFARYAPGSGLETWLDRSLRFYGVPAATRLTPKVTFVFTPAAHGTHAVQLGSNLVVEVIQGETPAQRADVVAHELSHYFYEEGRAGDDPAFIQAVYQAAGPHAGPAMGLINEGLATAIGQGAVQEALAPDKFKRALARPNGFYTNAEIDAYAKAIFPAVKQALLAGKPVRDLVPDLVAGYLRAFEHQPLTPARVLTNYMLVLEGRRDPAFADYFKAIPPRSIFHESLLDGGAFWTKYQGLPGLVALTADQVPELATQAASYGLTPAELASLRGAAPGVLIKPRPTGGSLFIVVAADRPALGRAMARFAALPRIEAGWMPLP